MGNFSAQNSITIKRLRTNDSLSLTFLGDSKPLYQFVNDSGQPVPDWTNASNQPTRTPVVTSLQGATVALDNFVWKYNGVTLDFSGAASGGWITSANEGGRFQLNPTTGAIKIVGNLASLTNIASDTLDFSCRATVLGLEYPISGTLTVTIQKGGSNAYYAYIESTRSVLTGNSGEDTATLTAYLLKGGTPAPVGKYQWYNGDNPIAAGGTSQTLTVNRSMVNGYTTFICKIYENATDTNPVAVAAFKIGDIADEYTVQFSKSNDAVAPGVNVVVTAYVVNMRTQQQLQNSDASNWQWDLGIYNPNSWGIISGTGLTSTATSTSSTCNITVTTGHTDIAGGDVEVLADVQFTV